MLTFYVLRMPFVIQANHLCLLNGEFTVFTFIITAEIFVQAKTFGDVLDSSLSHVIYQRILWTPPSKSLQTPQPFTPPSLVQVAAAVATQPVSAFSF